MEFIKKKEAPKNQDHPMVLLTKYGYSEVVEVLHKLGGSLEVRDKQGRTLMDIALEN